jgi:nucleotide-binding universal stress UspA family protein
MIPSETTRLVVGADATGLADPAIETALELARRLPARLTVLHAVELPPADWLTFGSVDPARAEREVLVARRREMEEHLQGFLDVRGVADLAAAELLEVRRGAPAQVLVEGARDLEAALIVLGPHRKHGFFDFGGTARAVLAEAPCDLWVQPGPFRGIARILVPVDLSEHSLDALRAAIALAGRLDARLTVLHCHQAPALLYAPTNLGYPILGPSFDEEALRRSIEERFHQVLGRIDWQGIEHRARFVECEPVAGVRELEGEHDLVVLGSHGRTGLARAVLGNVAYAVLKHASIPVLAIRGSARAWLLG